MTSQPAPLELGYCLPTYEGGIGDTRPAGRSSYAELREVARLVEQVGFHTAFAPDHFLYRNRTLPPAVTPPGESLGVWEVWTVLSALAEATSRITLGPFVAATPFRSPALLAKIAETLDEVSGGRVVLAIGAGWNEHDFEPFGFRFDHLVSRFEEALAILVPLLRTGRADFEGEYYQVRDGELRPRGPRPEGMPIWIGANQPRMLRLVAQHADAYNTAWHMTTASAAAQLAKLDDACRDVARDPATLRRTIGTMITLPDRDGSTDGLRQGVLSGGSEQIADQLQAFHALGIDHITCLLDPLGPIGVERFAPVIELLQKRGVMA